MKAKSQAEMKMVEFRVERASKIKGDGVTVLTKLEPW